jgi:two-component system cell cycle sensor histidine kinase/response regulator CckA
MRDEEKSKAQLIQELRALREQLTDRGGGAESSARASEQAPADSEARYRALSDQLRRQRLMLDGCSERIMATDLEGRVLFANAAFARQVGRSPEELVGVQLTTLPGRPLEGADGRDVLEAVVADGRWEGRWLHPMPDDSHRLIDLRVQLLRDERGEPQAVCGVGRDITEQSRAAEEKTQLQSQLVQSQKMEAIGRLAGGVAHDFNNLLTGIQCYAQMIVDSLKPADPLRDDIAEISKAADRAAGLTQQLLAFSRKQIVDPKILDLNVLLIDAHRMLERLIGEDVQISCIRGEQLGRVRVDPHQIDQVVVNLAVNARDAMVDGGTLVIETSNALVDAAMVEQHPGSQEGSYVMLAVSDTGCGMDADTSGRVFEPFYTTKEEGKGTGLGLSTVYGIVQQNGGFLNVYSEPGIGTTFKVYLPREGQPTEVAAEGRKAVSFIGDETILLVEDEEVVRRLARKILASKGYHVLEAGRGTDACMISQGFDGQIDLLLTDVVMPSMNGKQVYEHVREGRPEIRVLYMSGYTGDVIVHHGVLEPGVDFVQKPFTVELLARRVREVLDDAQRTP